VLCHERAAAAVLCRDDCSGGQASESMRGRRGRKGRRARRAGRSRLHLCCSQLASGPSAPSTPPAQPVRSAFSTRSPRSPLPDSLHTPDAGGLEGQVAQHAEARAGWATTGGSAAGECTVQLGRLLGLLCLSCCPAAVLPPLACCQPAVVRSLIVSLSRAYILWAGDTDYRCPRVLLSACLLSPRAL